MSAAEELIESWANISYHVQLCPEKRLGL